MIGPAHVSGLDGQVELVADVGSGIAVAVGRAVSGPGVGVGGVALAAVGSPIPKTLAVLTLTFVLFCRLSTGLARQ